MKVPKAVKISNGHEQVTFNETKSTEYKTLTVPKYSVDKSNHMKADQMESDR